MTSHSTRASCIQMLFIEISPRPHHKNSLKLNYNKHTLNSINAVRADADLKMNEWTDLLHQSNWIRANAKPKTLIAILALLLIDNIEFVIVQWCFLLRYIWCAWLWLLSVTEWLSCPPFGRLLIETHVYFKPDITRVNIKRHSGQNWENRVLRVRYRKEKSTKRSLTKSISLVITI